MEERRRQKIGLRIVGASAILAGGLALGSSGLLNWRFEFALIVMAFGMHVVGYALGYTDGASAPPQRQDG